MDITEFLEARISEDEAVAKACPDPEWRIAIDGSGSLWVEGLLIHASDTMWEGAIAVADAEHATRHDPARALAECAAKRAIIQEHGNGLTYTSPWCETCAEWWASEMGEGPPGVAWPCTTLKAVAAVYAGHPDYQQEWANAS